MIGDLFLIRRQLAELTDDALYARTVEAIRMARSCMSGSGQYTELDRAWTTECWYLWWSRGKPERYTEAVKEAAKER